MQQYENLTYQKVLEMFAESSKLIDRLSAKAEKDREQAEKDREQAEKDREQVEKDREQAEKDREQAEKDRKELRRLQKLSNDTNKRIADISDNIGRFAEEQVRPKILYLFRHRIPSPDLQFVSSRFEVETNDDIFLAEFDLLLTNDVDNSVAVEVKNRLRQADVDEHLDRLEKVKSHPNRKKNKFIDGTTMYGAVAGMIVTREVERYAMKKGLYVVAPSGEGVEVKNKPDFKAASWEIPYV